MPPLHDNPWTRWSTEHLPVTAKVLPRATRWIALAISLLVALSASALLTVFCWQNAMRAILNQTETASNVMMSIGSFGIAFSFPGGVMVDYLGNQIVSLVAEILIALSCFFLSLATGPANFRHFFANNLWVVDVVYFFLGIGCSIAAMAILFPNLSNFHGKHAGLVIGLIEGMANLGPAIYSVIYNLGFTNGYVKAGEEGNQNLSGYFLLILFFTAFSNVGAFLFVGPVKHETISEDQSDLLSLKAPVDPGDHGDLVASSYGIRGEGGDKNEINDEKIPILSASARGDIDQPANEFADYPFEEFPLPKVIRRLNFWLILLQLAMNWGVQDTWRNNLETYLRSFNLSQYDLIFTVINTIVCVVSNVGSGFASDVIVSRGMPRASILIAPVALQTLVLFISTFYGSNHVVFIITGLSMSISMGFTFTQPLILSNDLFGSKHANTKWGVLFLGSAALILPISLGFSALYQRAIGPSDGLYCNGLHCFTWSFLMMSAISLVNLGVVIWLTVNMVINRRKRRAAA